MTTVASSNTASFHLQTTTTTTMKTGTGATPVVGYLDKSAHLSMESNNQKIELRTCKKLDTTESNSCSPKLIFAAIYRFFQILSYLIDVCMHNASVESVKNAVDKLGSVNLKVVQFILSNPDMAKIIFGDNFQDYVDALSHTTHKNKPMSKAELEQCLKKAKIPYHREALNPEVNLGVGSVGDVHKIVDKDGNTLVVKLISPSSETHILTDIPIIKFVLRLIHFFAPSKISTGQVHTLSNFLDKIKDELNLTIEIENTDKQREIFLKYQPVNSKIRFQPNSRCAALECCVQLKVPVIKKQYSSEKAMVMDEIHGMTLSDTDNSKLIQIMAKVFNKAPALFTDSDAVAFKDRIKTLIREEWLHQCELTGFFNSDLHGGNLMVAEENGKLCIYFIDFGNAHQLSDAQKNTIFEVIALMTYIENPSSRITDDTLDTLDTLDTMLRHIQSLTAPHGDVAIDWKIIKEKVVQKTNQSDFDPDNLIQEILEIAQQNGAYIPSEICCFFRCLALLEG